MSMVPLSASDWPVPEPPAAGVSVMLGNAEVIPDASFCRYG